MDIYVENEYDKLTDVVVGNSFNFKSQINFRDLYDPISLFHYLKGSFPNKFKLRIFVGMCLAIDNFANCT